MLNFRLSPHAHVIQLQSMKLQYLSDISPLGQDFNANAMKILRLYSFEPAEVVGLQSAIQLTLLTAMEPLVVDSLPFVHAENCRLTLRIADHDAGISTEDAFQFFCDLLPSSYEGMLELLQPFTSSSPNTHQWLYDLPCKIEFLISPTGQW